MTLHWIDREDEDNPGCKWSVAIFAGGWLRAEVHHTTTEDEDEVPWNATVKGDKKSYALVGYENMEEAKRAAEVKIAEIVEEMRKSL